MGRILTTVMPGRRWGNRRDRTPGKRKGKDVYQDPTHISLFPYFSPSESHVLNFALPSSFPTAAYYLLIHHRTPWVSSHPIPSSNVSMLLPSPNPVLITPLFYFVIPISFPGPLDLHGPVLIIPSFLSWFPVSLAPSWSSRYSCFVPCPPWPPWSPWSRHSCLVPRPPWSPRSLWSRHSIPVPSDVSTSLVFPWFNYYQDPPHISSAPPPLPKRHLVRDPSFSLPGFPGHNFLSFYAPTIAYGCFQSLIITIPWIPVASWYLIVRTSQSVPSSHIPDQLARPNSLTVASAARIIMFVSFWVSLSPDHKFGPSDRLRGALSLRFSNSWVTGSTVLSYGLPGSSLFLEAWPSPSCLSPGSKSCLDWSLSITRHHWNFIAFACFTRVLILTSPLLGLEVSSTFLHIEKPPESLLIIASLDFLPFHVGRAFNRYLFWGTMSSLVIDSWSGTPTASDPDPGSPRLVLASRDFGRRAGVMSRISFRTDPFSRKRVIGGDRTHRRVKTWSLGLGRDGLGYSGFGLSEFGNVNEGIEWTKTKRRYMLKELSGSGYDFVSHDFLYIYDEDFLACPFSFLSSPRIVFTIVQRRHVGVHVLPRLTFT